MRRITALFLAALLACTSSYAQVTTNPSVTGRGVNLSNAASITGTLPPNRGGTGVANAAASTITLGGPLVTSGAFTTTITSTNTTNSTLPAGTHSLAPLDSPSFTTPTLGAANATSINFGGTALSSYVEGSWTPTNVSGFSAFSFTTASTKYVRIGGVIMAWAELTITSTGTSIVVGGLPVAPGWDAMSCGQGEFSPTTVTYMLCDGSTSSVTIVTAGTVTTTSVRLFLLYHS